MRGTYDPASTRQLDLDFMADAAAASQIDDISSISGYQHEEMMMSQMINPIETTIFNKNDEMEHEMRD